MGPHVSFCTLGLALAAAPLLAVVTVIAAGPVLAAGIDSLPKMKRCFGSSKNRGEEASLFCTVAIDVHFLFH